MKRHYLFTVLLLMVCSCQLLSQNRFEEEGGSNCGYDLETSMSLEKWLNRSFDSAKNAILNGRNGKKLPQCKIDDFKKIMDKVHLFYFCGPGRGSNGEGGTKHTNVKKGIEYGKGGPFIRIIDPFQKQIFPNEISGCIEGLIVHELMHAIGDPTESGAVDCSKILFPCAPDPWGDETPGNKNCDCCDESL